MPEAIVAAITSLFLLVVQLFSVSPADITIDGPVLPARNELATVAYVVDGDTIAVTLSDGKLVRVRYIGIDTPEPYREGEPQCGSLAATARNRELVEEKEVTLVADREDTDRYDRLLRYVYVDGVMVNEVLIREGFADTLSVPPNTAYAAQFTEFKNEARAAAVGIWGDCRE